MPLDTIDHILIVLSGKGGVGKSTIACQLAFAFAYGLHPSATDSAHQQSTLLTTPNLKVGILDVDLCGPSVPKILGVEGNGVLSGARGGWLPVRAPLGASAKGVLEVMSIGFLLPSLSDAVVWRGPRKDAMIKQFLEDVEWGASNGPTVATRDGLNVLIVDTPPGTSDEHMTLCEALVTNLKSLAAQGRKVPNVGAVVVTTPQAVSLDDVIKELNFCQRLQLRCFGIVENMDGYVCPHCRTLVPIFSTKKEQPTSAEGQSKGIDGGRALAETFGVPYLGSVPLDPMLSLSEDEGVWIETKVPTESSSEGAAAEDAQCGTKSANGELPSVAALRNVVAATIAQMVRSETLRAAEQASS